MFAIFAACLFINCLLCRIINFLRTLLALDFLAEITQQCVKNVGRLLVAPAFVWQQALGKQYFPALQYFCTSTITGAGMPSSSMAYAGLPFCGRALISSLYASGAMVRRASCALNFDNFRPFQVNCLACLQSLDGFFWLFLSASFTASLRR